MINACAIPINGGGNTDPVDPPSTFVHVESILIEAEKTILEIGDRTSYTVTVNPSNADDPDFEITSSDTSIVSITDKYLEAKKIGKATITATSYDGDKTSSIEIEVVEQIIIDEIIHVTDLEVSIDKTDIFAGEIATYTVTITPEDATDSSYSVSNSDRSVLSTFTNGQIMGIGEGTANVTIRSNDNPSLYRVLTINVTAKPLPDTSKGFPLDGYTLDWSDEFEGTSLSDDWEAMIGNGRRYGIRGWGNNELQYYKEENAVVKDGYLHIIAQSETIEDEDEGTFKYTSARLRTMGKVTTTYGYIEARMRLPAGSGMWPAFWMLPETRYQNSGWPTSGEIDIMEARGRLLRNYGSTIHSANQNGQDVYHGDDYRLEENNNITQWHCYGCEWLEDRFNFFIDGEHWFTCEAKQYQNNNTNYTAFGSSAPFNKDFHILLNLAVGGNYDGNSRPDETIESAEMLVDFVRIYTK